jgi:hypothetical protein
MRRPKGSSAKLPRLRKKPTIDSVDVRVLDPFALTAPLQFLSLERHGDDLFIKKIVIPSSRQ